MRRLALLIALTPVLATACTAPFGIGESHERTVLVDYKSDQVVAVVPAYFPKQITVRAGDTVVFKQTWNGEPHTVTMGQMVDKPFGAFWPILKSGPPFPKEPPNTPAVQAAVKLENLIPHLPSQEGFDITQNGGQPCYLDSGTPPEDPNTACPKRPQPAFNGRQVLYNSGMIPYQGVDGNTYKVPVAADTKPGTYFFFCTLHGPVMSGSITVTDKSASIPSQSDVNTQAQAEIDRYINPTLDALKKAQTGKAELPVAWAGNLAGYSTDTLPATINQFIPGTVHSKVGQKVSWLIVGNTHTISFDVPPYVPEITRDQNGNVHFDPRATKAVGGPGFPAPAGGGPGSGPPPSGPPTITTIDAGDYDGSHFLSSGIGGEGSDLSAYSVTFTKAGNYKYACLVHPAMVGEVDVT